MVQAHARELLNQKESVSGTGYMSDMLFDATERLMSAMERLEHNVRMAAAKRVDEVRHAEQAALFEEENQSLRHERETLNATIEQLNHDYDDLQGVAGAIYNKLSDSIKRLTSIVGE